MTATVTDTDILLRLLAALAAGGLIGFDRGTRGRIAGLRTTILMCLAATGAMIEANLMLGVTGRTAASFTTMDALRFPLGILSGIGFIGAGAIVRRGQLVTGVTTAATMWLVTVIGLILGAGYFGLGAILTAAAFVVLNLLKRMEKRLTREHRAVLHLRLAKSGMSNDDLRAAVRDAGFTLTAFDITCDEDGARAIVLRLEWVSAQSQEMPPLLVDRLAGESGLLCLRWEPLEAGHLSE